MSNKQRSRIRRAKRSRIKMRELGAVRLSVHRTPQHIYAQIIDSSGQEVLTQASTLDKSLKLKQTGNKEAAKTVGATIATRAKDIGISKVAFDRSGYLYHGRIKALADEARSKGLEF